MERVHAVRSTPTEAASSTCTPARTDDGERARSSYYSHRGSKQHLYSCTNRRWRACTQFVLLPQKQQAALVLLHEQTMERVCSQFVQLARRQQKTPVLLHEQTMERVHAVRTTRLAAASRTCAPARTDDGERARSFCNSHRSSKQHLCSCTNKRWRGCRSFCNSHRSSI